ncbi:MAG: gas vesicle protein K [Pseudanabaenaceae cyanobacterium bins.39]|nr:gas vesicle protein K [Pseudanabaenaceae cyanobacterium bins.39]
MSDHNLSISLSDSSPESLVIKPKDSGLAPLILTLVELLRQLMEAQIIRRMDNGNLTEIEIERAADGLQALEQQILNLCEVLDINPEDLNIDLGEFGKLLPKRGAYYPNQFSSESSILELLDRLISTGIVLEGDVQIGLANINLIDLKLKLLLTSGNLSK